MIELMNIYELLDIVALVAAGVGLAFRNEIKEFIKRRKYFKHFDEMVLLIREGKQTLDFIQKALEDGVLDLDEIQELILHAKKVKSIMDDIEMNGHKANGH